VNRNHWFFKQSVTADDMNRADSATEGYARAHHLETEEPFGIVSGYTVAETAGMNIEVSGASVAYDRNGRRIVPTTVPLTQAINLASDGGSTGVVTPGNERWISVFARGGRKFSDPATDGNTLAVRATSIEVLNALGDADHPAGAYDGTAAKEAGIDKFYIVAGTEDTVGYASRPALIDDGVLICDIRLTYGLTTLTVVNLAFDRRQNLVSEGVAATAGFRDIYAGLGPLVGSQQVPIGGLTQPPLIVGLSSGMLFRVTNGAGFFYNAGLEPSDKAYRRFKIGTVYVEVAPSNVSNPRRDLIVVDGDGGVRVVTGTPAPLAVPPSVPAGTIALAEVFIYPSTANTLTAPILRRGFRRLPYPHSTVTGILEGCRIGYSWASGTTALPYIESKYNKVAFRGEVVEFAGGVTFTADADQDANPLAVSTTAMRAFYFYVCRNQFHEASKQSVTVLMSMTLPHPETGHPIVNLRTSFMQAVPKEEALLIGVGWTHSGTLIMPTVQGADGWFYPQLTLLQPLTTVPNVGTAIVFPSAPGTPFVDQVLLKVVLTPDASSGTNMFLCPYSNPEAGANILRLLSHGPLAGGHILDVAEVTAPAPGGGLYMYSTGAGTWAVMPVGYHLNLPRVNWGGLAV
jgi:hypothetical protein